MQPSQRSQACRDHDQLHAQQCAPALHLRPLHLPARRQRRRQRRHGGLWPPTDQDRLDDIGGQQFCDRPVAAALQHPWSPECRRQRAFTNVLSAHARGGACAAPSGVSVAATTGITCPAPGTEDAAHDRRVAGGAVNGGEVAGLGIGAGGGRGDRHRAPITTKTLG